MRLSVVCARGIACTVVIGCLLGMAGASAQEAPGLVAQWSFDEVEGRLTPDGSGNANDGMVTTAMLVKGVNRTALLFDGRFSSVACMPSASLELDSALTLEAWVQPRTTAFPNYPTVVRRDHSFALRFGDGGLALILWFEGEPVYLRSAMTDWEAERWYHVAGTYDGAEMRLFIDGEEDGASPQARTGRFDAPANHVCVGSVRGQYALHGVIDEVRLYDHALAPGDIARSHEQGRQTLQAQRDVTVEPREVGEASVEFRKPEREIAMVQPGFIWIDAEDFTDYGGWLLDTQFVHLMGSAYLIAAGIGEPVDEATVEVNVPEAGTYRLWVRARNWLQEHSPGRFRVAVDGQAAEKVFGRADTEEWLWEAAGEFELQPGAVTLALQDLTGYYGRCDALVLTTDMGYTPPKELEASRQERSRLTGVSLEPQDGGEYDVIVVGAGAAGSTAALSAARMGAKTALIQNRPVLGGNSSIELGVPINGAGSSHPNARESGIIEEVGRIKARFGHPKMSEPFRTAAEGETNLSVFLNQHVFDVEMADQKRIAAVKALDTLRNTVTVYRAQVFLDCTGDGWVGFFARAEHRLGRESREEFDESLAPEQADKITMSGCIMGERALSYRAADMGQPTPYTPPPWAAKLPPAGEFGRNPRGFTSGQWWLEHRGDIDDLYDAERARDELIRITFGYWDYIKNEWPDRERAANYALAYVPIRDAKRESRRLVGDHILTQSDVQSARVFPDRISYGGWPLDVHHPEGIFSGKEGPFDCNPQVPIYTIPFRCLYSVNIDNLLMAGRDMSVTHVALGSVRVQGTLSAMGQAAGTAAALCVRHKTTPRGIYQERMAELQQTLVKHDLYIPDIRNEDPLDLARGAKLAASSTAEFEEFGRANVQKEETHPLNMARAMMFPTGERKRLEAIHVLLRSEREEPTELTLHLRGADGTGDFSSREEVATASAVVPAGEEGWVEFKLEREIDVPFAWVWLPTTEGVEWRLMASGPLGACRAYGGGAEGDWTVVKGQFYAFHTDPPLALKAGYDMENLTNGLTRIIEREPNMWASDPTRPLPQWVELRFAEPTEINTVYLTFDTDMNAPFHTVPLPRQCVRDYELACDEGEGWKTLAAVKGNFQRRRVHRFEATAMSKLRLIVQATNGAESARVFEVRAYKE